MPRTHVIVDTAPGTTWVAPQWVQNSDGTWQLAGGAFVPRGEAVAVASGRDRVRDGTPDRMDDDKDNLSDGIVFSRKLAVEYVDFYRQYVPGCENLELVTTAPAMGVRDSRRIVGRFELGIDDFLARQQFPDQVAVYNRPTDVRRATRAKESTNASQGALCRVPG